MPRIELVKTTLVHKGFDTFVKMRVHKDIEEYFAKASEGMNDLGELVPQTEVSDNWRDENGNGLTFYRKGKNMSSLVSNKGQRINVQDSFGASVLSGKLNVAFLRIKGISHDDGVMIETTELISGDSLRRFLKDLRDWIKGFYESELMNQELEGAVFVDTGV